LPEAPPIVPDVPPLSDVQVPDVQVPDVTVTVTVPDVPLPPVDGAVQWVSPLVGHVTTTALCTLP
jgi:hypothetical protein